jgi:hypothetical protein
MRCLAVAKSADFLRFEDKKGLNVNEIAEIRKLGAVDDKSGWRKFEILLEDWMKLLPTQQVRVVYQKEDQRVN